MRPISELVKEVNEALDEDEAGNLDCDEVSHQRGVHFMSLSGMTDGDVADLEEFLSRYVPPTEYFIEKDLDPILNVRWPLQ